MGTERHRLRKLSVLLASVVATFAAGVDVAYGEAAAETSSQQLRFNDQAIVVPGQGTFVINGTVHVLLHSTLDAAGGCHIVGHVNPQGLSVRTPAGSTFSAGGGSTFTLQSTDDWSRFHGVLNLALIARGNAPDLMLHANVKTEPSIPAGDCDAAETLQLIIEELGITFPS